MARILIVEDEERLVSFLTKGLEANGHSTMAIGDGVTAAAVATDADFDLTILDIGLPGQDGFAVLAQMRARGERMPVILLTARSEAVDTVAGFDVGGDPVPASRSGPLPGAAAVDGVGLRLRTGVQHASTCASATSARSWAPTGSRPSAAWATACAPTECRSPVAGVLGQASAVDLLLIRHALPERVETVGRPADPPLAELGHRQAMALAEWLSRESVDALYVSPMRRARQTARPVAAVTGLDPVVVEGVAEFDRHAEAYIPLEELKAAKDPRYQELLDGKYFEDGELDAAGFQRTVVDAVDGIIAENRSRSAAVVCHGGVINAYVGHVLGLEQFMIFEPTYTGITRIRASSAGHRMIVTLNEFSHLRSL